MRPPSERPADYAGPVDVAELEVDDSPGPPEPPQQKPVAALRPLEFARWIWRQLTSMRTALILLFLLALAAIPGSLIPQTKVDPSAVAAWQQRHPGITPLFEKLGVFSVYSSVWFGAIYVLLMVSLIGCIVPRLRVYLRGVRAVPPPAPRHLDRLPAYARWTTTTTVDESADAAEALLRGERRRVRRYASGDPNNAVEPGTVGPTVVVSAEKGYLREAGNLLFHLALLVVLVGVAVVGLYGFKGTVAVVSGRGFSNTLTQYDSFTPGARFDVANLAPFSFNVDDFNVTWKRSGAGAGTPLSFDADLTVTPEPGAKPYDYDLRVNHPLELEGTSVFLVGHGYAPVVTVRDGAGHVAFRGPVVFLPQDGSFLSFGVVKAPDAKPTQLGFQGYFFPTGGLCNGVPCSTFPGPDHPVLSLIPYHGNLGLDSGAAQSVYVLDTSHLTEYKTADGKPRALIMTQGETKSLGKGQGSIRFDGYTQWVQLQVSHQPGKLVPLVGVLAAILGLLGSLFVRPRRTWVRVGRRDGRTVVEVAALDRVAGGDPVEHVEAIRARLEPGTDDRSEEETS